MRNGRAHVPVRAAYTHKTGAYSSHSLLLEHFPPLAQPCRVLDVGGGEGYLSRILADRGYDVVCLASPGSVAGELSNAVRVVEADLDNVRPDFDEMFNIVLCGDVIEHLRRPLETLRWLGALLKPSGKLVASLPNSGHWYFRVTVLSGRFPAHDRGLFDRTHLHFYTWSGWRELLEDAGFVIDSIKPTSLPFGLALGLADSNPAVRFAEWSSYRLALLWKSLFAYQFVVSASLASGGSKLK